MEIMADVLRSYRPAGKGEGDLMGCGCIRKGRDKKRHFGSPNTLLVLGRTARQKTPYRSPPPVQPNHTTVLNPKSRNQPHPPTLSKLVMRTPYHPVPDPNP